jgi:UDP-glucose:(heptosyl)LPS alpha-1,3-glucosyltransferase
VSVVYDGVNLEQFDDRKGGEYRSEVRESLGIPDKEVVLVFAGNPFSRKGLEYVIRALPLVKRDVKLLVLGKDDIAPYLDLARELGVEKKVIYAGFTTEIQKYFAAADIFVFPTVYEAFGLVITEAMASGLPVVTSASAGAAELIEDGKDGLLLKDPSDHEAIAGCINRIVDKDMFVKLGSAAREKIERYTWERTARDMLAVFEKVTG